MFLIGELADYTIDVVVAIDVLSGQSLHDGVPVEEYHVDIAVEVEHTSQITRRF